MATVALGAPYRRLWSATLLSNLGDGIRAAAFPLLAVALTRDPRPATRDPRPATRDPRPATRY